MNYPHKRRLKLLGHLRAFEPEERADVAERLSVLSYRARVERLVVVAVEAFDWICPQHITPRYTTREVEQPWRRFTNGSLRSKRYWPHAGLSARKNLVRSCPMSAPTRQAAVSKADRGIGLTWQLGRPGLHRVPDHGGPWLIRGDTKLSRTVIRGGCDRR